MGGTVGSLVRWGDDGLAFWSTANNEVVLIRIPRSWFTSGPQLALSPGSLVFPVQALSTTSASRTVTLTNNTSGTIAVSSIAVTGDFAQTNKLRLQYRNSCDVHHHSDVYSHAAREAQRHANHPEQRPRKPAHHRFEWNREHFIPTSFCHFDQPGKRGRGFSGLHADSDR